MAVTATMQHIERMLTPTVIVYATIAQAFSELFVVVFAVVPLPYKQERLAVLGDVVKVDAGRGPIVADCDTRVLELALAAWNVRLSRKVEAAQARAAVIVGIAMTLAVAQKERLQVRAAPNVGDAG